MRCTGQNKTVHYCSCTLFKCNVITVFVCDRRDLKMCPYHYQGVNPLLEASFIEGFTVATTGVFCQ